MSETIDHVRPSYSAPQLNSRDEDHESAREEVAERQSHPGDIHEEDDRWEGGMNNRVPRRPPGELRSVDE